MKRYVVDVMSANPMLVDERSKASTALAWATSHRVHYLVIPRDEGAVGVVCLCDLERTNGRVPVSACMHTPAITVDTQQTVDSAVRLMEDHAVGCLPVVDWLSDLLQGVITRRNLRPFAPHSTFVNRSCAACGTANGLIHLETSQVDFCRRCVAAATDPRTTANDPYLALG